jgi:hypothetical protein
MALGLGLGQVKGLQGKTKPHLTLSRLPHIPAFATDSICQGSSPGWGHFGPLPLFPGLWGPWNLPLPHRGPGLVRALGPLSVPETKTIPLWLPRHQKVCLPTELLTALFPFQCLPTHPQHLPQGSSIPLLPHSNTFHSSPLTARRPNATF